MDVWPLRLRQYSLASMLRLQLLSRNSVVFFSKSCSENLLQYQKGIFHQCLSFSTENTSKKGPLHGVKILDLTRVLAGPFATMVLSDLGASVIKVEKPGMGDETRTWGPPFVGSESCYFLGINRNKSSLAVDLKTPEGVDILKSLAAQCDVFMENFVPGSLARVGLSYDDLQASCPGLIYCSLTGYGPTGPYSKRPGYDVMAASIGGLMSVTGPAQGPPCKVGIAMTDLATALFAHGAIMAALIERSKTGRGQKIDCDLLSTQVACMTNLASSYLNGNVEERNPT
ncbi:succinate--hydroxymethylglutarate CoA-transferase-like isoform X4 [Hyalella azteca]|uniref:Succinate--hydroxymethylglutarate CoA-transferase-like isoform X4 n=1 Tax=Hyalella azteca TaxID=294128 RepID=A0A979FWY1_HYAAZ|nr:succinate--hydroxymethylglutarate CoA-transferase-like isoform X4 [Hyalella azteca]